MNFLKMPSLVKLLFPHLVWDQKKEGQRHLYLTFDDGPVPEITPFVLETLAAYEAKATFFCVGENIDRYPEIFQQVEAAGHRTGNHTYHHLNGWKTSTSDYLRDISHCDQVMQSLQKSSVGNRLFRPPYGKLNLRQMFSLRRDYRIIMWDILSGDFDKSFPTEACLQKSIAHSGPGTIIIFHDSYKAAKNLQYVLPRYLEHFASAGYQFASL